MHDTHSFSLQVEDTLIEVGPRDGEQSISDDDLISAIQEHGAQTALVLVSGP